MDNQEKNAGARSLSSIRDMLRGNMKTAVPEEPVVVPAEEVNTAPASAAPVSEGEPVAPAVGEPPAGQKAPPAETPPVSVPVEETALEKKEPVAAPGFPQGDKDKLTLDIEWAVINILKDRQFKERLIHNQEVELAGKKTEYDTLKREVDRLQAERNERNQETEKLREALAVQKLNYDQLVEDFREHQRESLAREEEIRRQLEREQDKYKQMSAEFETFKTEYMKQYNIIRDVVRDKAVENRQLTEQIRKVQDEKEELLKTIREFTSRMTGNLSMMDPVPGMEPEVKTQNSTPESSEKAESTGKPDSPEEPVKEETAIPQMDPATGLPLN